MYDIIICGGGLAGLTLAHELIINNKIFRYLCVTSVQYLWRKIVKYGSKCCKEYKNLIVFFSFQISGIKSISNHIFRITFLHLVNQALYFSHLNKKS